MWTFSFESCWNLDDQRSRVSIEKSGFTSA